MKTYCINTECGLKREFEAESLEAAKEIYANEYSYDFEGAVDGDYPGSWFFIEEDGVRVEDHTKDMP